MLAYLFLSESKKSKKETTNSFCFFLNVPFFDIFITMKMEDRKSKNKNLLLMCHSEVKHKPWPLMIFPRQVEELEK